MLADVVRQQNRSVGEDANYVEVGLRRQAGKDMVISTGVGFGVGEDRSKPAS